MKRSTRFLAGAVLMLCLAMMALAPVALAKKPWEKIKTPVLNEIKMPAYERVVLDNGMILYLAEDHQFPLVELSFNQGERITEAAREGLGRRIL